MTATPIGRPHTIVFLHGHDDDPARFTPLVEAAWPADAGTIEMPRGPVTTASGRAAWFESGDEGPIDGGVRAALDAVDATVSTISGAVVIGGFSQGAAVALTWLLDGSRRPATIAGVFCLAGWLLDADEVSIEPAQAAGIPVLVAHGEMDEVVPHPLGRGAARLLDRNGATVDFVSRDVGHDPNAFVRDLAEWCASLDQEQPLHRPPT